MASLKESINADRTNYTKVEASFQALNPSLNDNLQPTYNPMIRCPLPPTYVSPDSLRQFYTGGQVPQYRLLPPNPVANGGGTVVQTVNNNITSSSSSSTGPQIKALSVSLTTPILNPGNTFTNSVSISKSFQLLSVATSNATRIELYGTALAQTLDLSRGLDVAFPAGTSQNIITDIALDVTPYVWSWQNKIGANADSPQTGTLYVTITNIDVVTTAITATIQYVSLET